MPKRALPIIHTWARATSDFLIYQMARFALIAWILLLVAIGLGFVSLENSRSQGARIRLELCRDIHDQTQVMRQIISLSATVPKGHPPLTAAEALRRGRFLAETNKLLDGADCDPSTFTH